MNVPGATPPQANGGTILRSRVRLALSDALGSDAARMGIDVAGGTVSFAGDVRAPGRRELAGLPGTNARGFTP